MRLRRAIRLFRQPLLLMAAVVVLACAGCASEPDNESAKPWSSPEGWQNGNLPNQMFQH